LNTNIIKYWEHVDRSVDLDLEKDFYQVKFPKKHRGSDTSMPCFSIKRQEKEFKLKAGYFVGVDWIDKNNAIYIAPKLNKDDKELDYIKMLFSSLKHEDISKHIKELFIIKWDEPKIEIEQKMIY